MKWKGREKWTWNGPGNLWEVGDEMGVQYAEGIFMAEGNLLEDEERANERQKLDGAGLIFHVFFF